MTERIVVTGGTGFLGWHVGMALAAKKASYELWGHEHVDLNIASSTLRAFQKAKPQVVYHLAAQVGGIGANQRSPAVFWRDNTMMGINVLDACLAVGVQRLVLVSTTCGYPCNAPIPFKEEDFWNGYPEPTNAPYGIAKKSLVVGALAYGKQFGLDVVVAIPTNLYGPHDNFDPETSHVIPALMQKIQFARLHKLPAIEIWGSGAPTRDFLYAEDAARGLLDICEKAPKGSMMNLGSNQEVSIRQVAKIIAKIAGWNGAFKFDTRQPDGQPRRLLDTTRAQTLIGWKPKIDLFDGLARTYQWWMSKTEVTR